MGRTQRLDNLMNKRIKELLKQATTIEVMSGRGFDTTQYIDRFDEQKFAELIVSECINVIRADYVDLGTTAAVNNIEKHFGVEE